MRSKPRIADYIKKHWLLVGIFVCILLASLNPGLGATEGPLKPEYTVKYGAVSTIFLISGLSMRVDSIKQTVHHTTLHMYIQTFTFLLIPIVVQILRLPLSFLGVHPWILKGLVTTACMPPPVSSAVILTKSAQGNETAAIFNSVLGSFLGIIVTPLLLLIHVGFTTIRPLSDSAVQLGASVILPLIIGQILRHCTDFNKKGLPLNGISQGALLFIVYSTFCDTFQAPDTGLNAPDILAAMILVLLLQILLLSLSFVCARRLDFNPPDVVCATFCSTHKSLTLGIPILRILFKGLSHLSHITLPLLVYHPTQMILGGLLITYLKEWVNSCPSRSKRPPI